MIINNSNLGKEIEDYIEYKIAHLRQKFDLGNFDPHIELLCRKKKYEVRLRSKLIEAKFMSENGTNIFHCVDKVMQTLGKIISRKKRKNIKRRRMIYTRKKQLDNLSFNDPFDNYDFGHTEYFSVRL